jgi:N-methylhydantoinase B
LKGGDTTMVVFGDGDVETNYGLFGGKGSVLNKIELKYKSGKKLIPMSKDMIHGIPDNTLYYQIAGGGGGYGNPKKRDKEKVLQDVKNEVVSKKVAEKIYGIKN